MPEASYYSSHFPCAGTKVLPFQKTAGETVQAQETETAVALPQ